MMETEIVSSRRKTVLLLLFSLGFVAISMFLPGPPDSGLLWSGVFFSVCSTVFIGLLIRPQRLVIDKSGFTLAGGLIRSPRKVEWQDLEGFFVVHVAHGAKLIGFNYSNNAVGRRRGTEFSRRVAGCDGAIPGVWPGGEAAVVDQLNGYLTRAIQVGDTLDSRLGESRPHENR
jgi:hypothetical protein